MLLCLLDDKRQVPASAVFHENVQDTCVAVNKAVVVLYDMRMVEILQNVASCMSDERFLLRYKQRRRTPRPQLACDRVHSCVRIRSPSELRSMLRSTAVGALPKEHSRPHLVSA
jgi:hypothetical protein